MKIDLTDLRTMDEPYLRCAVKLNQDVETLSIEFSKIAIYLLEKINVNPRLTKKYRLEVKFDYHTWVAEFQLWLDPLAWFDTYLMPMGYEEALNIAQKYIASSQERFQFDSTMDTENEPHVTTLRDKYNIFDICSNYKDDTCVNRNCSELQYAINDCSYCLSSRVITNRTCCLSYIDEYIERPHPNFVCKTMVETSDGRIESCGQYIPDSLRIHSLSDGNYSTTENFAICLRRDLYQELLLIPESHVINELLAKSVDVWKYILKLHRRLGFHLVGFNFGAWESGKAYNKYSLECHGHVHLCFDPNAWDIIYKESAGWKDIDNSVFMRLNECKQPGPNYLIQNCHDLKNHPPLRDCREKQLVDKLNYLHFTNDPLGEWWEQIGENMKNGETYDGCVINVKKPSTS